MRQREFTARFHSVIPSLRPRASLNFHFVILNEVKDLLNATQLSQILRCAQEDRGKSRCSTRGGMGDRSRMVVPRLETARLVLQRVRPDHAADLFKTVGDPDVMRYWAPGPDNTIEATARRIADIESHWTAHGFGDWGVVERATGQLVGFSGLHYIAGMPEVNVEYAFEKSRSTPWRRK